MQDLDRLRFVGLVYERLRAQVLPCGHVQLVKGVDQTTVEFPAAVEYARDLQRQLEEAVRRTIENKPASLNAS